MEPLGDQPMESAVPPIWSTDTLKDALLAMVACGRPVLPVVNGDGDPQGQISLHGLQRVVANRAQGLPAGESGARTIATL